MDPSIFEEWNQNIFGFAEDILFTLHMKVSTEGGVQYVWTNILIFKFIIPQTN